MSKNSANTILHAKSNEFYWQGNGRLSIKTFSNGRAYYKTSKGFFAVEEERYLLLNHGPYEISIDENYIVESFCLFFKDGLAEEVMRTFQDSSEKLVDDPFKPMNTVHFFEKTYERNLMLDYQLNELKNYFSLFPNDVLWKEEQFYKIMQTLLHIHQNTIKNIDSLQALKFSTREEIYRRISIAHDYIHAFFSRPITLLEIAKVAGLSQNHLLRSYSEVFRKTPHQYITELRLKKAKQLLSNFEYNITDIAFEIGFNHPVSFSKMFKKYVGISPLQFRKKVILDKK